MLIKLTAYAALGLAMLNTAEIIGLVEPGRYLSGLPRWDVTSFSPAARQVIGQANSGIGMAKDGVGLARHGYAQLQHLGSQAADGSYLPQAHTTPADGLTQHLNTLHVPDEPATTNHRPGGVHFSRTTDPSTL